MFLFGKLIKSPFIHLFANYSSANHLTIHPSIPLVSYFYAIHLFGELFSCRPFNFPSVYSFGELFSYFCVVHSLGELFSCRPFNSPSFGEFFFMCRPYNVHRFGELFLCRTSLGRVIFVPTI